jgi:hypothetical protein
MSDLDNDSSKMSSMSSMSNKTKKQEQENTNQIDKEFKEAVIKYVKLDDLIREKEDELKELKKQRKPNEEFILTYLEKINENIIDITEGKLRRNKSETKTALNRDIIKKAILDTIKDPKLTDDILTNMDNMRPMKTSINLKRTGKHNKNQN